MYISSLYMFAATIILFNNKIKIYLMLAHNHVEKFHKSIPIIAKCLSARHYKHDSSQSALREIRAYYPTKVCLSDPLTCSSHPNCI